MFCSYYPSPLGILEIKSSDVGLQVVGFIDDQDRSVTVLPNAITEETIKQLHEYFEGKRKMFDLPLDPVGTVFQQKVWEQLVEIPYGRTCTYSTIANRLNNPLSTRAVGTANGRNPIAIIIPCHRVIGADGSMTGYAGGLWRKEQLLLLEGFLKEQSTLW